MSMFEKLSLFGFKNCKSAPFAGKLLAMHPPINGSFQNFLAALKSHFTLRICVVSVCAINLLRI